MRARLGINALLGQPQPLHRPPRHQVLGHNLLGIFRFHVPVPHRVGINHHRRPVLALVQAAGLVDPHLPSQSGLAAQLLQPRVQFALSIGGAARPRRIGGACVMADKNMAFECWQVQILPFKSSLSNSRCFDPFRLTRPRRRSPPLAALLHPGSWCKVFLAFSAPAPPPSAKMRL